MSKNTNGESPKKLLDGNVIFSITLKSCLIALLTVLQQYFQTKVSIRKFSNCVWLFLVLVPLVTRIFDVKKDLLLLKAILYLSFDFRLFFGFFQLHFNLLGFFVLIVFWKLAELLVWGQLCWRFYLYKGRECFFQDNNGL